MELTSYEIIGMLKTSGMLIVWTLLVAAAAVGIESIFRRN
jgi:hypothetical protein